MAYKGDVMHIELRNWFLYNLEISQYLSKTKLPDNAQSEEDSINNSSKKLIPEKNIKNKHILNSILEPANLRFAFWQPSENLIIFNEMNQDILPGNDVSELLANILSSIGYLPDSLPELRVIDFPVGVEGAQAIAEPSKMLSDFIDTRVKEGNTCLILLMGKTVFDVFSTSNLSYSDLLGKKININNEYKALILQSLQENLRSSIAKLGTWKAIKSLIIK
jgi:hypothetical protein